MPTITGFHTIRYLRVSAHAFTSPTRQAKLLHVPDQTVLSRRRKCLWRALGCCRALPAKLGRTMKR